MNYKNSNEDLKEFAFMFHEWNRNEPVAVSTARKSSFPEFIQKVTNLSEKVNYSISDALPIESVQWLPFNPIIQPWKGQSSLIVVNTEIEVETAEEHTSKSPVLSLTEETFVSIDCSQLSLSRILSSFQEGTASLAEGTDVNRSDSKMNIGCMNDIFQGSFEIEDLVLDLSLELPMMRRSVSSSTLLSSRLERRATTMHTTPTKLQVVEGYKEKE